MSDAKDETRPSEADFEAEVDLQRRAETWLMVRGATILLVVSGLVALRSLLL